MKALSFILALLAVAGLSACHKSGSSDSSPLPSGNFPDIAGSYSGTFTPVQASTTNLSMTLVQSGTSLTGTFSAVNGAVSGNITSGTVALDTFVATVTQTQPCSGSFNINGNVNEPILSGTISGSNCGGATSGTFTATKQ
jgi:hypothetical protein